MEHDRINTANPSGFHDPFSSILPSRQKIHLELSQAWIHDRLGLKTLTGESGIGKSFIWRNAAELVKSQCDDIRWIALSILPRNTSQGLLHAILIALEEAPVPFQLTPEQTLARVERRFLEIFADGFRPEIVVEESHHLSREGFETLRILKDRLSLHGIKVGILLVGQSPLRQKFGRLSRLWRPVGWHVQHIGAAETLALLQLSRTDAPWTRAEADWIHREALGNPGRIVRWTETFEPGQTKPLGVDSPIIKPGFGLVPKSAEAYASPPSYNQALLPVKPPLEESDGLIEVGYDESESDEAIEAAYDAATENSGYSPHDEPGMHEQESGTKYWIDAADSFAPYKPNSIKKERTLDWENES